MAVPGLRGISASSLQHLGVHDPPCLVDGDQAVGSDCFEALADAAGPTHFDVGGLLGAEAEVEAAVVHRQEARLPGDLLDLLAAAVPDQGAGADGAAVGFGGVELLLEPAVVAFDVVAQERGWFVEVDDENIEIAIVVEIAEGAAAATVRGAYAGPALLQ